MRRRNCELSELNITRIKQPSLKFKGVQQTSAQLLTTFRLEVSLLLQGSRLVSFLLAESRRDFERVIYNEVSLTPA